VEMMSSKTYSLNEEMAAYLIDTPDFDIKVTMLNGD
jgi:hypothetical protein